MMSKHDIVADYNGYDYKKIFWQDADRVYEDMADRIAIRKLLPKKITNFVDIAGGYGRLADEYLPCAEHATIFDYSKTELKQAKDKYGDKISVQDGDIYALPFADASFDALMMIRATHHFKDMPKVTRELSRILEPGGIAVVEVANKRTLPRMARFIARKTKVNPWSRKPSKVDGYNMYNYHPKYIEQVFKNAGFKIDRVLSVSNFRSARLKKLFGTKNLVKAENLVQRPLAFVRFAPSIYYRLVKK